MTAKPLTRSEFERLYEELKCVPQDAWDRILVTIGAGKFAPDPPTPYELDEWTAKHIMGWSASAATWVKLDDTLARFHNVIDMRDWKPSVDLGQALECVAKANRVISLSIYVEGQAGVRASFAEVPGTSIYEGPYDEAQIAEAVLRTLYKELAS